MEENYMEEKKKSKKGTVFIIVLLILIILGLVGYICYDKGLIFKTEKEVVKKEKKAKEKSVKFTDEELNKYVNYISPVNNVTGPCSLLYDTSEVDANKLSSAEKIQYIGGNLFKKITTTSDYAYSVVSEDDVKASVEEVYGPDTYEKTTFNLGCGDYILRENEGKYYSKTGCGGTTATAVSNVVIGYKATKKKLEITTAYVFLDGIAGKIYKDYDMSVVLDSYTNGYSSEGEAYLNNYAKENKDKLNHIVYTFESKDGEHYYFKGFKNNK